MVITPYTELTWLQHKFRYKFRSPLLVLRWGNRNRMCDIEISFIKFLDLAQHIACMEYIQLYRMFKITKGWCPFPMPESLCGTSFICWRFCLLAVICQAIHQLADIYVVLLHILQYVLHCVLFRVFVSILPINTCCKQIIGGCKIQNLCIWID